MYIEKRKNDHVVVLTGYETIDYAGSMLRRGKLSIVAGRPGMGKTAFALNLIKKLLARGKTVFYVSTEMHSTFVYERLREITGLNKPAGLVVSDRLNAVSTANYQKEVLLEEGSKVDVIIIDDAANLDAEVITHCLADLPNTAVLITLPVVRDVESREDHRPGVNDILGLDAYRQDVYCVATLYRDDYYDFENWITAYPETRRFEICFHIWDLQKCTVSLSYYPGGLLEEFRDGICFEEELAEDTREGIFRFIDSEEYRSFFLDTNCPILPLEKVWFAWHCKSATEEEKISAILEYARESPDYIIEARPGFPEQMTLERFADRLCALYTEDERYDEDNLWLRTACSSFWFDFPVIHSQGDLLVERDTDGPVYLYLGEDKMTEGKWERLQKSGTNSDMEIPVWTYDNDGRLVRKRILPFDLEPYQGIVSGYIQKLAFISNFLRRNSGIIDFLNDYSGK